MKLRLSEPGALIDIARIPELAGIREKDGQIEIGAATVHHAVATSTLLQERCSDRLRRGGHDWRSRRCAIAARSAAAWRTPIRRPTMPAVMLALDAEIQIQSASGRASVKATDFFQDLFTVDLQPDEIITAVRFAPVKAAAYEKLYQKASHYAIVGVAAALDVKGGKIQSARIGLTGATTHAMRLTNVEQALAGQPLSAATIESAAQIAGKDLKEINADIHASETYRRAMIPVFTRRALEGAAARA